MVPTSWTSDGFSKPVMVGAKAKGEKGPTLQRLLLRVWYRGNDMSLLQMLMHLLYPFFCFQISATLYFFVVFFSVLIADLLTRKERVLLVCVMATSPVAVDGNRTMLLTGLVLGQKAYLPVWF